MRNSQKLIAAFLLSVLITSIVSILSFKFFFKRINLTFSNEKVSMQVEERLKSFEDLLKKENDRVFTKLDILKQNSLLREPFYKTIAEVSMLDALKTMLSKENIMLLGLRAISDRQLIYSSFEEDRTATKNLPEAKDDPELRKEGIYVYRSINDLNESEKIKEVVKSGKHKFFVDKTTNSFVYAININDEFERQLGTLLFYCSYGPFEKQAMFLNYINLGEQIDLEKDAIFVNMPLEVKSSLLAQYDPLKIDYSFNPFLIMSRYGNYYLYNIQKDGIKYIYFLNTNMVFYTPYLIYIIMFVMFSTIFLLIYFLMQFRKSKEEIVLSRMRKLQFKIINEYLTSYSGAKFKEFEEDLNIRKSEIKEFLKRGLKLEHHGKIDKFIEDGMDNVISVFKNKIKIKELEGMTEKKIENIIKKAMSSEIAPLEGRILDFLKSNAKAVDTQDEEDVFVVTTVEELEDDKDKQGD